MAISPAVARDFDGAASALIKRIIPNLNLLADLLHADVLLFARAGSQVEVLEHAQRERGADLCAQHEGGGVFGGQAVSVQHAVFSFTYSVFRVP